MMEALLTWSLLGQDRDFLLSNQRVNCAKEKGRGSVDEPDSECNVNDDGFAVTFANTP